MKVNRAILDNNTKIIAFDSNPHKLKIKEALYIMQRQPSINKQDERFDSILPLYVDCGVGLGRGRHNNIGTKIDTHTAVGTHTSLLKRDFRFKKFVDVVPSGEVVLAMIQNFVVSMAPFVLHATLQPLILT